MLKTVLVICSFLTGALIFPAVSAGLGEDSAKLGLTRDECRFTRANGSLPARRALHATNVALHEPTAPYPPEGLYTR